MSIAFVRSLALGAAVAFFASSSPAAEPVKAGALDTQTQMNAVTEALQAVGPVKEAVKRYRLAHDGFPASNAEAGVPPPAQFASNSVRTITVGPDGVIDVTLTAASGLDGGLIRFHPDYAPQSGGGDVHWSCASETYANIGDLTGGNCEHTKMP